MRKIKKDEVFDAFVIIAFALTFVFSLIAIYATVIGKIDVKDVIQTLKELVFYVLGVLSGLLLPRDRGKTSPKT